MSAAEQSPLRIAIACGGTGGHLFPGVAVAHELKRRGCAVTLLVSRKEIDQTAVQGLSDMEVLALPAIGLSRGRLPGFLYGFARSYRQAARYFAGRPAQAVLAMGGFTSAPPVLAARRRGARCFLHESNTIPGRANRWLSWVVTRAFVAFPETAPRLHAGSVRITGTPVRPQFKPRDPATCRWALGLEAERPTVLVTGGSQGASGINSLVLQTLPILARTAPDLQWLHLTGPADLEIVKAAYAAQGMRAAVHPFLQEMELALGAASVAVSRAGGSSLAEMAAMGVVPILIPFPAATDNHQFYNARALQESGGALLLSQQDADPEKLSRLLLDLTLNPGARSIMQRSLRAWHRPDAAARIAQSMLTSLGASTEVESPENTGTETAPSGTTEHLELSGLQAPQAARAEHVARREVAA